MDVVDPRLLDPRALAFLTTVLVPGTAPIEGTRETKLQSLCYSRRNLHLMMVQSGGLV
jgi:hypothetical protein